MIYNFPGWPPYKKQEINTKSYMVIVWLHVL